MPSEKLKGYDFYKSIGSPKQIAAPMVEQSYLPFRMLTRKHGAQLAYTPMLNSKLMTNVQDYIPKNFSTVPEDYPLFTQLCGNDPEKILKAAKMVESESTAIDINFGCPQNIAKKGNYGSFLLEKPNVIESIIKEQDKNQRIPVTAKIRLLPNLDDTISQAKRIENAGASILTIHCRTKEQNKQYVGKYDWEAIKQIKKELKIPVFANGGIYHWKDVVRCLAETNCDGVMSSESLLENPGLFSGELPDLDLMAKEYLESWKQYGDSDPKAILKHLFKILHSGLAKHTDLRAKLGKARKIEEYEEVVEEMGKRRKDDSQQSKFGWYERHWGKNYVGDDADLRSMLRRDKDFHKD